MEDIEKMKVAELKKELKNFGLSTDGKKPDLIQRLSDHLKAEKQILAGASDEVDDLEALEKNVLGEEEVLKSPAAKPAPEPVAAKPAPAPTTKPGREPIKSPPKSDDGDVAQKKLRLSTEGGSEMAKLGGTDAEARKARAAKFGVPEVTVMTAEERKAARAAKFGVVEASSGKGNGASVKSSAPAKDPEKLKSRAARFGLPINPTTGTAIASGVAPEKLKARQDRFGVVAAATVSTSADPEKLAKRAERFGAVESTAAVTAVSDPAVVDEAKSKRAARFGATATA